jgi:adenosine deaminase
LSSPRTPLHKSRSPGSPRTPQSPPLVSTYLVSGQWSLNPPFSLAVTPANTPSRRQFRRIKRDSTTSLNSDRSKPIRLSQQKSFILKHEESDAKERVYACRSSGLDLFFPSASFKVASFPDLSKYDFVQLYNSTETRCSTKIDSLDVDTVMRIFFRQLQLSDKHRNILKVFLKTVRKGGVLHAHLTGEIPAEHFFREAGRNGLQYYTGEPIANQFEPYTFHANSLCANHKGQPCSSTKDFESNDELYQKFLKTISMTGMKKESSNSSRFFKSFSYIETISPYLSLGRRLYLALSNEDNVAYKEFMEEFVAESKAHPLPSTYSRVRFDQWLKDQGEIQPVTPETLLTSGICEEWLKRLTESHWLETFVKETKETLAKGFEEAAFLLRRKVKKYKEHPSSEIDLADPDKSPTMIRIVLEVLRHYDPPKFFAEMAAACALAAASPEYVGGITIDGPEHTLSATRWYLSQMHIIEFLRTHYPKVKFTLHMGELNRDMGLSSERATRLYDTLTIAKPERGGHCSCLSDSTNYRNVLKQMKETGFIVEIAPSSNEQILGLSIKTGEHPVHEYMRAGIKVTINTDDGGVLRTTIDEEIEKFLIGFREVNKEPLSIERFKEIVIDNPIEGAFLDKSIKDRLRVAVNKEWNTLQTDILGRIMTGLSLIKA